MKSGTISGWTKTTYTDWVMDKLGCMRYLIFLDVDGTVVDYHNRIPTSAEKAISSARAHQHRVYLCTGRSKAEVYPELLELGIDGLICGNGSYVEDATAMGTPEVVFEQTLSSKQCSEVVAWLTARNLPFYLECNAGLFGSADFLTGAQAAIHAYSKSKGNLMTVEQAFPEMIFGAELERPDVNKISFILRSYQDHLDATRAFPDLISGTWGGRGAEALFGDLGVPNISKANAIAKLLEHRGVDRTATIAVGDAKVDISMLEYCRIGIAMGNASSDVKAIADYITDDVEKDGLYNAFAHYKLL